MFDPMYQVINGYILKSGKVKFCESTFKFNSTEIVLKTGRCKFIKRNIPESVLNDFKKVLVENNKKIFNCTVLDGFEFRLEGVINKTRFAFDADSPSGCEDKNSKDVDSLIEKIMFEEESS